MANRFDQTVAPCGAYMRSRANRENPRLNTLVPMAAMLTVAAITPGPNNYLVFQAAAGRGLRAAGVVGASVLAGSAALFGVTAVGMDALAETAPRLVEAAGLAASTWLVWAGWRMATAAGAGDAPPADQRLQSPVAMALFQLVNPKAWTVAAAAATAAERAQSLWLAGGMLLAISAACLTVWAFAGAGVARMIGTASGRRMDRAMGALLALSGAALIFDIVR
jgi:threonine/homoserine/homoserine lactone efflux protein